MTITTRVTLTATVSSWLNRTDFTQAQLNTFVQLAEAQIRHDVRCRGNMSVVTGTTTDNFISTPGDMIEVRTLTLDDEPQMSVPPQTFTAYSYAGKTDGYYTVIGDYIYVLVAAGTAYELVYWGEIEGLNADADSNWLLLKQPDIYLYATCMQAAMFLLDGQQVQYYAGQYAAAVARLNKQEQMVAHGESITMRAA